MFLVTIGEKTYFYMLLGGRIEGGSNPQVVVLSVLTDVGVLEQSADPGFSLQLLMV